MLALGQLRQIIRWNLSDKTMPPPQAIKQRIVKQYQSRYSLNVFVETGTYLGDMVDAMKSSFREIYSVELSQELYERARDRFRSEPNIHLLQGDSSDVLPQILKDLREPALFWLDGHFSGGVTARGEVDFPILVELDHIRNHPIKNHVILIDDARVFTGDSNVPAREKIVESLRAINAAYSIQETSDIIRACQTPDTST